MKTLSLLSALVLALPAPGCSSGNMQSAAIEDGTRITTAQSATTRSATTPPDAQSAQKESAQKKSTQKEKPAMSKSGHDLTPLPKEKISEIVKKLEPIEVEVTQRAGTERAGSGKLLKEKRPGTYVSVVGGLPLFRSEDKFESGTGWPSFTKPIDPEHVILKTDTSHGMTRVEVLDARSGAHLGHLFDDGPQPTGKRYCMNSAALKFVPDGEPLPPESQPLKTSDASPAKEKDAGKSSAAQPGQQTETAYFAAGCFWGVEDVFAQIPGVLDAVSGYMGGKVQQPTYKQVCSGATQHAETVKVVYDPARVTYRALLKVFFDNHDPTTLNRQGPDVGDQYRSAIFAGTPEQKQAAEEYVAEVARTPRFEKRKIVTQIVDPGPTFWPAEEYHQDYHAKHGGSCKVKVY